MSNSDINSMVIVNSVIGRKGSIGQRYTSVINALNPTRVIAKPSISRSVRPLLVSGAVSICRSTAKRYRFRLIERLLRRLEYWAMFFEVIILSSPIGRMDQVLMRDCHLGLLKYFKRRGIKLIIDVAIMPARMVEDLHGNAFTKDNFLLSNELASFAIVDKILVPSKMMLEWFHANGFHSAVYVPFGVQAPRDPRKSLPAKRDGVLFLGANTARKGVSIVEEVAGRRPDLSFYFLGDGFEVGIFENRNYLGFQKKIDWSLYQVAILPTKVEGCSKAVIEALLNGLPVVTTRYSGIEPLIGVFFVDPDSPDEIIHALNLAIEVSADTGMSKVIKSEALDIYSECLYEKRLRSVIDAV